MPSVAATPVTQLHEVAERIARVLAQYPDVIAVSLVGSVARGNADDASDIDLLVITEDAVRPTHLLRRLPRSLRDERLSFLNFSRIRWEEDVGRGNLFLQHVRIEGRTLYDPHDVLARGLKALAAREPDVSGEIETQRRRLRLYRDLERLNGQHLFTLAHLYRIGKATAIAQCVALGEPVFVKEDALVKLASRRPHLASAASRVARLRPFYVLERGRRDADLPFPPVGAEAEIRQAIDAIELLASG
ncbi:MAG: hypothetical protein QOI67_2015 [Gaiellaceae bacterium]|jgi:predicted nucleotidyltransferase|nr:hypothetical protein [Gaiellaceae bacterium]